jgi:hypothetical protein
MSWYHWVGLGVFAILVIGFLLSASNEDLHKFNNNTQDFDD